jgi:hypothetical protein
VVEARRRQEPGRHPLPPPPTNDEAAQDGGKHRRRRRWSRRRPRYHCGTTPPPLPVAPPGAHPPPPNTLVGAPQPSPLVADDPDAPVVVQSTARADLHPHLRARACPPQNLSGARMLDRAPTHAPVAPRADCQRALRGPSVVPQPQPSPHSPPRPHPIHPRCARQSQQSRDPVT